LVDIAGQVGIDSDEFRNNMGEGAQSLAAEAIDDHNNAVNSGINGVPAVVVNDEFPFTGAQETEFYRNIVNNLNKPH
ncbi:MAG: DsbA family protein, partial [Acidimicrobiales bacterium]